MYLIVCHFFFQSSSPSVSPSVSHSPSIAASPDLNRAVSPTEKTDLKCEIWESSRFAYNTQATVCSYYKVLKNILFN